MQLKQNNGFTLIELLVVISLISITLVFAMPRFHHNTILSDSTKTVSRWIILKVQSLKQRAAHDQKLYALHVDIDANRLWITNESMSEEEIENALLKAFELPDDINVLDVEYPEKEKASSGQADIFFYKKGYSDRALVHISNEDNERFSFLIETFLSKVKLLEDYVSFEE